MPIYHSKRHLSSAIILGLIIPTCGLLFANRVKLALLVPVTAILWVCLLSWTRLVITPGGFLSLLGGLLLIHLFSYGYGLRLLFNRHSKAGLRQSYGLTALFIVLIASIALCCHLYKATWFGFAFYHIPSKSMAPTLQPADIVLVDTWTYKHVAPTVGDIVIFKRSENTMVLAKRASEIRAKNGSIELFMIGDNHNSSVDSRHFGWVNTDYLIGKVEFVWFSFLVTSRYLVKTH